MSVVKMTVFMKMSPSLQDPATEFYIQPGLEPPETRGAATQIGRIAPLYPGLRLSG